MWKLMLTLLLAWTITGCGSGGTLIVETSPVYPSGMLERCPKQLPELTDARPGSLLLNHAESAEMYHRCKDNHNALVDEIERSGK